MDFSTQIEEITALANRELQSAPMQPRSREARLNAVGNIYALYVDGELKYIGKSKLEYLSNRLNGHLYGSGFSVDENGKQTGYVSKWHRVSEALNNNQQITFKCILITPETLRGVVEEELILLHDPEWNEQS